jgi:demethylmenaquinone methyltransferase/2-methoxy-6-polyprenyl-1,4-benzoquinol methylase
MSTTAGLQSLGGEEKRSYVRSMFTAIAPRYDLLNHLLSFNIDRRWRRRAVDRLGWEAAPGGTYLDLCAGTLDLAAELARRKGFAGRVVGADFAVPMLRRGISKAARMRPIGADALELPFPDATFSGCAVGFGVRNLADIDSGLTEVARVLQPGARFVVLEFATPTFWPARWLYLFYFRRVLPPIGRMVSKHTSAYSYLPASVDGFPDPHELRDRIAARGFRKVVAEPLTLGVASLCWGIRE